LGILGVEDMGEEEGFTNTRGAMEEDT